MTRLNLTETCLLEVSGELGAKAHEQLREHIEKFPAAQLEYELIKGQFELLRSAPKVTLTPDQQRQIASQIKQGLHRKLRQKEREEQAALRWKFTYQALAVMTAAAACIVIGMTIFTVNAAMERRDQNNRIEKINSLIAAMGNSDRENDTDRAIHDVAAGITELQGGSPTLSSSQSKEMTDLLDALANVPEHPAPPAAPGSL
jgi:hypothetical protein